MHWTMHVKLRPGGPGQMDARLQGETAQEAMLDMDDWVLENGRPGDQVEWTREGPNVAGAGTYGSFVIQ
jgi:hypothetical protein